MNTILTLAIHVGKINSNMWCELVFSKTSSKAPEFKICENQKIGFLTFMVSDVKIKELKSGKKQKVMLVETIEVETDEEYHTMVKYIMDTLSDFKYDLIKTNYMGVQ